MATVILRPRLATQTARLSVRPFQADDFEAWRTANAESPPADSPHDPGPKPVAELTRVQFRILLRRHAKLIKNDICYNFVLLDRAEKTMFGLVSLQIVARIIVQQAWIGWRVLGQHRRKGYAKEGVQGVLGVAFRELLLHRVEAGIEPQNRASAKLARSLGMRKESSEKRSCYIRDVWSDVDVYAIQAEDCGVQSVPTYAMSLSDERRVEPR